MSGPDSRLQSECFFQTQQQVGYFIGHPLSYSCRKLLRVALHKLPLEVTTHHREGRPDGRLSKSKTMHNWVDLR